jgi:N4-gp56 family major capsid protein
MARKLYSVATFAEMQRQPSFRKNLIGPAPKQTAAERKLKGQSSPDYPFVQIKDLQSEQGDKVTVDLFNLITGYPVMGDELIDGKSMNLSASSQEIRIDQYRGNVDAGGRMTRKRTVHNLRGIAMANLAAWNNRIEDELCLVHAAGARGYDNAADWSIPLASHPQFEAICVNKVQPPTVNRRLFAGSATSVADLGTTDKFSLEDIDRMRAQINDQAFPMQPVRLKGDQQADDNPLYVLYVTSRQWNDLLTTSGGANSQSWRNFIAQAYERARNWNHPLFSGTPGMWNGILVKQMRRAVRFPAGNTVKEVQADGSISSVDAAVNTDRALLLGAQALACVYGNSGPSDYFFDWFEEMTDKENRLEITTAAMGGKAKIRFTNQLGEPTDHGVMTYDSYATDPNG